MATQFSRLLAVLPKSKDRKAIDMICKDFGYDDVEELVRTTGYSSKSEFLADFNFTSLHDFFFGIGWYERLAPFRRPNGNGNGHGISDGAQEHPQ